MKQKKVDEIAAQPDAFAVFDDARFEIVLEGPPDQYREHMAQIAPDNFVVFAGSFGEGGLWKKTSGHPAVRISGTGEYANPIVTPDGEWVVVAKTDTDWAAPNYIVRFNLKTGREYRVDLAPADQFDSVAYVSSHGKVLLRRAKEEYGSSAAKGVGPDDPEYYLLDPASGTIQLTKGEFEPLRQGGRRFLQPTGKANEFWAALPDRAKNQTQLGRYDLKTFSFQPILLLPKILFPSTSMWVSEAEGKIYLVYQGQLLQLPLRPEGAEPRR